MNGRERAAGDILDAQCTRCRVLTNHTIVALVAGKVARVKCNTCGSEHNYHAPKEEKPPAGRRAPVVKERPASSLPGKKEPPPRFREEWEAALAGREVSSAERYDLAGRYRRDTLLSHPAFGVGIVVKVAGNKMEVLFRDGPKLLRCGK